MSESEVGAPAASVAKSESAAGAGSVNESAPDVVGALLGEAASKTGLVWVRPAGGTRAWGVWHAWHEGTVLVASGPGEQELPDLSGPAELMVRSKDNGARLVTVRVTPEVLDPSSESWLAAAAVLAPGRLNSAQLPAELPEHWRATGVRITRLTPTGESVEKPGSYDDASGAAAPPANPATTSGWMPWHLSGRRGRRARKAAERRERDQREGTR